MTTSLLTQEMRRTYAAQRGVSQGAHITLAAVSGGWQARFECARRCAHVLGTRNLITDYEETIIFTIPMEEIHKSITKLADTFSVALVDSVIDEQGSRFVLVWKIVSNRVLVGALIAADELDEY